MEVHRHHTLLPEGAPGTVLEWLHLVPAGTFHGVDGRGPYKIGDAAKLIAVSMAAGKLPLDECHSTDLAAPKGVASPARGWIVELQSRPDGLWGRVDWCESGRQLMADRAYRGISPVFTTDKSGVLQQVLRASMTNTPNLADLQTLHHQETGVDLSRLRKALGLVDTADEPAILAAAEAATGAATKHSAQLAEIATAAGAPGADAPALVLALQTQRAAAGDTAAMAGKVLGLETQLQTMRAASSTASATAYIDAQIKAGKPIASLREHFITRHAADAAAVEKEIAALPSIHAGGMTRDALHAESDADGDGLTPQEMSAARKMGVDPKKMSETKKRMREEADRP